MEIFRSYRRQKEAIVSFSGLVWQLCQQNTHCTLTQKTQERFKGPARNADRRTDGQRAPQSASMRTSHSSCARCPRSNLLHTSISCCTLTDDTLSTSQITQNELNLTLPIWMLSLLSFLKSTRRCFHDVALF